MPTLFCRAAQRCPPEEYMLKHYLISFLISMVPLIELRGALPYALANGIPTLPAYIVCLIANSVKRILADGKETEKIPVYTDGVHEIEVILG